MMYDHLCLNFTATLESLVVNIVYLKSESIFLYKPKGKC